MDAPSVGDNAFIADHDAVDSAAEDDDDDDKPKTGQKQGRRKIKIEFIQDKSRRHITFSKRKAGECSSPNATVPVSHSFSRHHEKGNFFSAFTHRPLTPLQAYELSTLTGTQVLLLVVSETGLVYTFTTAKLQPLVTQPEGKNLIQACLNAPHGTLPSSMPVGPPLGRSSGPMGGPGGPPVSNNMPGGLSISGGQPASSKDEDDPDDDESSHGGRASSGDKRRRRSSTTNASSGSGTPSSNTRGATSPHSSNSVPPPLSIPSGGPASHSQHSAQPQINIGSPTSPQQQHQPPATSPAQYSAGGTYGHHPSQQQHHQQQHDSSPLYPSHLMGSAGYSYPQGGGGPPPQSSGVGGLAAAAAQQHSHWPQQSQVQGSGYGRR
jgi:hypothetical protein